MAKTTWERTAVQNLLRNKESGRFFGRWTVGGKQIWRKLDMDVFTVAKLRLADEAAKIEALRGLEAARRGQTLETVETGKGTVEDLMQV